MVKASTGLIALLVIVVVVGLAFATGAIPLQSLNIGTSAGGGGMQTPPQLPPSTGQEFSGQLVVNVVHRNALDNAEARTEGTNIVTTYYKSFDEVSFFTIGSGSGNQLTIDPAQNSLLYISPNVPVGQNFYIAPSSTTDQNLNPKIIDFFFRDITGDGKRNWVFKWDLRDTPPPTAGQVSSTIGVFINSYTVGTTTLNSPADLTGVGTGSNVNNFIRWEQNVPQTTASAIFEYEIRINSTESTRWDRGLSNLEIPNIGLVPLTDFDEQLTSSETIYKLNFGTATLDNANYVTTAKNGNTVHPIPFKFVTSLQTSDVISVTLILKSLTASQGTTSVSDVVLVTEA